MIFFGFVRWYYRESPLAIITIWKNFLAFAIDFFGIRYHFATFFRPWKLVSVRYDEEESLVTRFFLNVAGRAVGIVVGIMMRSFAIVSGLIAFLVFFAAGIIVEIFWLLLPLALVFLFYQGVSFLV